MFERITKVFRRDPPERRADPAPAEGPAAPASEFPASRVSEWAATRGLTVWGDPGADETVSVYGTLRDHAWRMEVGRPSRDYIRGQELRARAELGLPEDVRALVLQRALYEDLRQRARAGSVDTGEGGAAASVPEEARWLAPCNELAWRGVPEVFWHRYAVLAERPRHGLLWVSARLAQLLVTWPDAGPDRDLPFMLVLRAGRCYLRMEYDGSNAQVLDHARRVFDAACRSALVAFGEA